MKNSENTMKMKRTSHTSGGNMAWIAMVLLALSFMSFTSLGFSDEHSKLFPSNPLQGEKVFVSKGCVKCHAVFGHGGRRGRDLGKTQLQRSVGGIVAMMWNHSPEMERLMTQPELLPTFNEEEMRSLLSYLFFLHYLGQPGSSDRGEKVIHEKGCLQCHSLSNEPKKIAPSLTGVTRFANPLSLLQAMWNHGYRMRRVMRQKGIPWPRFNGSEFVDLFAWLNSQSRFKAADETYLQPGNPSRGKELFMTKGCVACHTFDSKDIPQDLLKRRRNLHLSTDQLGIMIWNHGERFFDHQTKKMDQQPIMFEGNDMADITAYLYFLDFVRPAGDAQRGKQLFRTKGCIKCHSIFRKGGNVAPDLGLTNKTDNSIRAATMMWNHNRQMRLLMEKVGVIIPRFREQEMEDLLAYIQWEKEHHE